MQGSLMAVDTEPEIGGGPAYNMGTVLCTDGMPGLMRPNFPLSAHKDRVKTWPPFAVLSFLGPCPSTPSRKSQVFLGPPVFGLTGAFCLYQSLPPSLVRNAGIGMQEVSHGQWPRGTSFLGSTPPQGVCRPGPLPPRCRRLDLHGSPGALCSLNSK